MSVIRPKSSFLNAWRNVRSSSNSTGKSSPEAASPRLSGLEWVAFLVFGALVYCFSELCRLLSNDTLEQTVRLLLGAYHSQG